MTAVYVTSITEKAGRTMISAGLGKIWADNGKKIGYLKVISKANGSAGGVDTDAEFMQQVFSPGKADQLTSTPENLRLDYNRLSEGKDLILIEGPLNNGTKMMAEAIDARVIMVHDYNSDLSPSLAACKKIGKRFIGLFINKVPQNKLAKLQEQATKETKSASLPLLGILPESRQLYAMSVGEIAELIKGKILNNSEQSGNLVENFMLGAMSFNSGIDYFNRKANKAAILKGDRPDMHLAALQTSLSCLVISGGAQPIPMVAIQARDEKVPIISATGDVAGMISLIEKKMTTGRFSQFKKLPYLTDLIKKNSDMKTLAAV